MSRPTNEQKRRQKIARAMSKMTPDRVQKIEAAFALDATVEEACFYAGISPAAYYEWMKRNPDLLERFTALRNTPILAARQTVVKSLDTPEHAFKYLERKRPKEFGASSKVELSGKVDTSPQLEADDPEVLAVVSTFEANLRQVIAARRKTKGAPETP